MKELFENKIIDELYEIREEGFTRYYINNYGKLEETKKAEKVEDELIQYMKKFIKEKKDIDELFNKINMYEKYLLKEICFWYKPYYKLGFIDGINFKKEIKEIEGKSLSSTNINDIKKDSFFGEYYIDNIMKFIEDNRYNIWSKRKKYKKIMDSIEELKHKYPKVRKFFEDEKILILTEQELKAVFKIITLSKDINELEMLEVFRLGLKEGSSL